MSKFGYNIRLEIFLYFVRTVLVPVCNAVLGFTMQAKFLVILRILQIQIDTI